MDKKIGKFSDLVGYLGSKQTNDMILVTIVRDGIENFISVTLTKLETYKLNYIGLEIKESDDEELKLFGVDHGVKIRQVLNKNLKGYGLEDSIIIKINDKNISSIEDAKYILDNLNESNPIKITFIDKVGEINSFIFR
jgi:S1-C subfamily serine protease